MVHMESAPLLLVPEDEPAVQLPRLEKSRSYSVGCLSCCFGKGEENYGHNWSENGLSKSVKRAREWSESALNDAGSYICTGKRWKNLINRLRNSYKINTKGKKARQFQYDPANYALNFDEGCRQEGYLWQDQISSGEKQGSLI